jgi:hypothetical protein
MSSGFEVFQLSFSWLGVPKQHKQDRRKGAESAVREYEKAA